MTYSHVAPHLIRQLWPVILPGVEKIKSTNGESWLPEDIYAALVCNKASLYIFQKDGAHAGFGVLEVMQLPFEVTPVVNIWLGHFDAKENGHYGIEVTKLVASAAGIERSVFSTPQDNSWVKNFRRITSWYEV